jgi:hypothetical protein
MFMLCFALALVLPQRTSEFISDHDDLKGADLPSREPLSKARKICDEGHSFVAIKLNIHSANTHRTGASKTE